MPHATHAPMHRSFKPIIRPISQTLFTLSESSDFENAIRESVAWLARRCHGSLPSSAFDGEPFDLESQPGANPTSSVFVKNDEAAIWAAQLDFPDHSVPQRSWRTEIIVERREELIRFGTRLTNITRGGDALFSPTVPGLVRQIIERFRARVDDTLLGSSAWMIDNDEYYEYFLNLLLDEKRRLPIVAMGLDESNNCFMDERRIFDRLAGTVHLVKMNSAYCWRMTRLYSRQWSVFGGAVRIYMPGVNIWVDSPRRHRLFIANYADVDQVLDELANEILPRTFSFWEAEQRIPRFDTVRSAFDALVRARRAETGLSAPQQIPALQTEIVKLRQRIEDDEAAQNELLSEAEMKTRAVETDRDAAWAEVARLRVRVWRLENTQRGLVSDDKFLRSYEEFDSWAGEQLAGSIIVLPRATREIERKGSVCMIERLSQALLLLKEVYVPMRRGGGPRRSEFDNACRLLALEEASCFRNKNDAKSFPEYYVIYKGEKRLMDRHLKYGISTDLREMFRVYFFWDDEDKVVVIGSMPDHLDNNLTN
jgi:hypothetical protein